MPAALLQKFWQGPDGRLRLVLEIVSLNINTCHPVVPVDCVDLQDLGLKLLMQVIRHFMMILCDPGWLWKPLICSVHEVVAKLHFTTPLELRLESIPHVLEDSPHECWIAIYCTRWICVAVSPIRCVKSVAELED